MPVPENLNTYITALLFLLGAYLLVLYVGLIIWTVRDIRARSRDVLAQVIAPLLVALFNLPGLLVYVLVRPRTTLAEEYERSLAEEAMLQDVEVQRVCPSCRHHIEPDYIVCPNCHQQLRMRCIGCGRLLDPQWDVCPYCGLLREPDSLAEPSRQPTDVAAAVEQPAARGAVPRRNARRKPVDEFGLTADEAREFYGPADEGSEPAARKE